jgi:hypothetical protein
VKKCPACGAREEDDLLVVYPACGAAYDEESSPSPVEIAALENRILKRLTRKVATFIFGGFSVLTVVSVVTLVWQFRTLWSAGMSRLETVLNKRIDAEFKTERIQNTVTKVAEKQAASLLRDAVQPKIDSFDAFLRSLTEQNKANFDAINGELAILRERNRLMQLYDRAVNEADRKALEELMKIQDEPTNPLAALAGSLVLQVKNFYLFGTRLGDYQLVIHRFGLSDIELPSAAHSPESYSVDDLISGLRHDEDWHARAKCADLLGSRKVKSVPDELLRAAKTDKNLEVVRNALRSFCEVTGYTKPDVFAYQPAENWWREHMDDVNAKLSDR